MNYFDFWISFKETKRLKKFNRHMIPLNLWHGLFSICYLGCMFFILYAGFIGLFMVGLMYSIPGFFFVLDSSGVFELAKNSYTFAHIEVTVLAVLFFATMCYLFSLAGRCAIYFSINSNLALSNFFYKIKNSML